MIHAIKVINHFGESVEIELPHPEKTGMLVTDIEGLGPPVANINMTELATIDGSVYNSARLSSRNIVISLVLLPLATIEDTRLRIYKFFPIKKRVIIVIRTDRLECMTEGYVETVDPNIFSEQESCQISILCPDSYLYSLDKKIVYFTGIDSKFMFPFKNDSLSEKKLIMGETNNVNTKVLDYEGTIEVGITMIVYFKGSATGLIFYNNETRISLRIDDAVLEKTLGSNFKFGDKLTIVTQRGQRKAAVMRNGKSINIINALKRPIGWLTLKPGKNILSCNAVDGINNLDFRVEYQACYEAI